MVRVPQGVHDCYLGGILGSLQRRLNLVLEYLSDTLHRVRISAQDG